MEVVVKTRIVCFGNDIMRDDAVALRVGAELRRALAERGAAVDVVESAVAGYDLLDLLQGWERVILVEAVRLPGHEAGEVLELDPFVQGGALRLCSAREGIVRIVMEAGEKLGLAMPRVLVLYGIQGEDLCTFGEGLTPSVAAAVPRAVDAILRRLGPE
jgi:hydrogenase maturation protease